MIPESRMGAQRSDQTELQTMMRALARIERAIDTMASELRLDIRTERDTRGKHPALVIRAHGVRPAQDEPVEPTRD